MQIFLEERVIRLDDGHAQRARRLDADPVRDERRLNVQHVDLAGERHARGERGSRFHHAVFGIEREITRRLAQHAHVVLPALGILGGDEPALAAARRKVAKTVFGSTSTDDADSGSAVRDAVDACATMCEPIGAASETTREYTAEADGTHSPDR